MRPAVELILTYAPETGAIDVVSHAGDRRRTAVALAFVEELFPADARLEPVRLRRFDLSRLARPQAFPTAPEDGIASVRLVLARVELGGRRERVTFEVGNDGPRTMHEVSLEWFGARDLFSLPGRITKVKLAVRFEPRSGQRRARVVPVELTEPHGCNLRDRSDEERLICEKYLRRWGLVQDV
jgi:hypothetical protein